MPETTASFFPTISVNAWMFEARVTKMPVDFDEDENGKIDLLHATERDGTGAALKIGLVFGDGVKSGINGHRYRFDLQVLQPELLRNRLRAPGVDRPYSRAVRRRR